MANLLESVSTSRLIKCSLPIKFNLFSCLLLAILLCIILLLYEFRYTIKSVLLWAEAQEHWLIYVMVLGMFTLVSFPLTWGYTFLVIASGYLFGVPRGLITVVVTGNLGVAIAHYTLRTFSAKLPLTRFRNNDKIRAILMVVSGPRAFRVAMFARLTPIPFGLQNTLFAVSNINTKEYLMATVLGLLPAQIINIYLGSTLRSVEEVLSNKSTTATGLIVFIQVVIGVSLMIYIAAVARGELRKTLNQDFPSNYVLFNAPDPLLEV